jgi:hypothetical protein
LSRFLLTNLKMASASSVCNCIKTASGTPTCEECTWWLQPPIPRQHCGKTFKGQSVHSPSSCRRVPSHDCCGYFHLPSHCRYRHRGGLLMLGPQELTTTCPDSIPFHHLMKTKTVWLLRSCPLRPPMTTRMPWCYPHAAPFCLGLILGLIVSSSIVIFCDILIPRVASVSGCSWRSLARRSLCVYVQMRQMRQMGW